MREGAGGLNKLGRGFGELRGRDRGRELNSHYPAQIHLHTVELKQCLLNE